MAYPGNVLTFGNVVTDSPMLLVRFDFKFRLYITKIREPTKKDGLMKKPIHNGTFEVLDLPSWGYKVTSDDIEDNFRKSLESILDRTYSKLNDFYKIHSMYQMWYRNAETATFHEKGVNQLLQENLGEVDESN